MFVSWTRRRLVMVVLALIVAAGLGAIGASRFLRTHDSAIEISSQARAKLPRYVPTRSEWASLATEAVSEHVFRAEHLAEGKIAVDDDITTPIFSPYAGRVVRLLVKPSDVVERGQPLFIVEATDTVQGLNDFVAALSAMNTATSISRSWRPPSGCNESERTIWVVERCAMVTSTPASYSAAQMSCALAIAARTISSFSNSSVHWLFVPGGTS